MSNTDATPPSEIPIPIGLYSVLSVINLRIKQTGREGPRWKSVRAMAWRPEELREFLARLRPGKNGVE